MDSQDSNDAQSRAASVVKVLLDAFVKGGSNGSANAANELRRRTPLQIALGLKDIPPLGQLAADEADLRPLPPDLPP